MSRPTDEWKIDVPDIQENGDGTFSWKRPTDNHEPIAIDILDPIDAAHVLDDSDDQLDMMTIPHAEFLRLAERSALLTVCGTKLAVCEDRLLTGQVGFVERGIWLGLLAVCLLALCRSGTGRSRKLLGGR